MNPARAPFRLLRGRGRAVLWVALVLIVATAAPALAQDIFFTQSGGRGLQNAKMSARVSKVEGDTADLQAEMAKIQPFAKKPITTCSGPGDKLRWTGNDWLCDSETDPTVQGFAKKALPSCGAGQILSASGSEFNCVNSGFLSAEADPTVQGFAKAPLPNCGTGQVLSAAGDGLTCIADERGLTKEEDPYVHTFARTETAVSNCEAGKVLTMVGNRLECVFDAVGITVETDPKVQPFAKNDIAGYTLTACPAGDVLTAVDQAGLTLLKCEAGSAIVGPILSATKLGDLADVEATNPGADDVLRYDGGKWVSSDDRIGAATTNRWCHFTATEIVCDRDIPAPMPANACAANEIITWNGTVWGCADIGSTVGSAIALGQLSDVTITTPMDGQGLTYDGSGWVNGYNARIARYDSDVRVIDSSGGNGAIQMVVDGVGVVTVSGTRVGVGTANPTTPLHITNAVGGELLRLQGTGVNQDANVMLYAARRPFVRYTQSGVYEWYVGLDGADNAKFKFVPNGLWNNSLLTLTRDGNVGISTTNPNAKLDVYGDISATNLRLSGNLYVSGSQSIDGVVFADGGISASGVISATRFYGDGSQLSGLAAGDRILSGTTFVQATDSQSVTFVTDGQLRAIIGANGRVGIGTADPSYSIDARNDTANPVLRLGSSAAAGIPAIRLMETAGAGDHYGFSLEHNNTDNRLYLRRHDNSQPGVVALSVNRVGGDIGIGTTSPNAKLDVYGTVSATSFIGDGSQLTGIQKDRIVSGSSNVTVAQNGSVTISTAGGQRLVIGDTGKVLAADAAGVNDVVYGFGQAPTTGINRYNTGTETLSFVIGGTQRMLLQPGGLVIPSGALSMAGTNPVRWSGDTGIARQSSGVLEITNGTVGQWRDLWARDISATNLRLSGNLYVSGSQSIDGVVFANGGVSATGIVTATSFSGDGSLLTGMIKDRIVSGSSDVTVAQNGSVTISTNNQQRVVVGDNGYMGIGTAYPGRPLHISGGGEMLRLQGTNPGQSAVWYLYAAQSAYGVYIQNGVGSWIAGLDASDGAKFKLSSSGNFTNPSMVLTRTGNIGISTTNPNAKLDVYGDISATNLRLSGNLYVSGSQSIDGVVFANGGVSATGGISATYFSGDGSALTNVTAAQTDRVVSGSSRVLASENSSITIRTAGSDRMVVGANGRIGVGTDEPLSQLHLAQQRAPGYGHLTLGGVNNAGLITFMNPTGSPHGLVGYVSTTTNEFRVGAAGGSGVLTFHTGGSEKIRITNGGNVGIGTKEPSATLHVKGNVEIGSTSPGPQSIIAYNSARLQYGLLDLYNTTNGNVTLQTTFPTGHISLLPGSSGNVGINTSSPNAKLDVYGDISATNLRLSGNLYVSGSQSIDGVVFANGGVSATGTVTATHFSGDGSLLTGVPAGDRIVSGTSDVTVAQNGSVTITTAGGQRLLIGNTGNVGIGTVAPSNTIHVRGSGWGPNNPTLLIHTTGSIGHQGLGLYDDGTQAGIQSSQRHLFISSRNTNNVIWARSYGGNGEANQYWGYGGTFIAGAVPSSGQPGTLTQPSSTLHVSGTARISGWTAIGANITATTALDVYGDISATNLRLSGNLYVSGSQSIDGVVFANGGVSATGGISATYFSGDGSRLTNVTAAQTDRIVSNTTGILASMDRSLTFTTANAERMVIGENGNVGIGINPNAAAKLHIHGNTFQSNGEMTMYLGGMYAFKGSPTGTREADLRRPSTNTLAMATGGIERMRINASGLVGIGTQSPTASLQVSGSLIVGTTGQNTTPTLYVGTDGNVGIGTTAPTAKLHVSGVIAASNVLQGGLGLYLGNSNVWARQGVSQSFAIGSHVNVLSTKLIGFGDGSSSFYDSPLDAAIGRQGAGIVEVNRGHPGLYGDLWAREISATSLFINGQSISSQGDRIVSGSTQVLASDGSSITITTAGNDRIVIGENGDVGIGNVSPSHYFLDARDLVVGSGVGSNGLTIASGNASAGNLFFADGTGTIAQQAAGYIQYNHANDSMMFAVGSATERLRIASSGNVGIATAAPAATLQVSGTFIVSNTTQAAGKPSLFVSPTGAVGIGGIPQYGANLEVYGTTYFGGGPNSGSLAQLGGTTGSLYWRGMGTFAGNNTSAPVLIVKRENGAIAVDLIRTYTDNAVTPALFVKGDGKVGIGTTEPSTSLHISGTIRLADGGEACDANRAGAIRYTGGGEFEFCKGSGWLPMSAAGGLDADRIVSGSTRVLASENSSVTIRTAGNDRMVVGENGYVGIGTSQPASEMHLESTRKTGFGPHLLVRAGKASGQAASVAYQRATSAEQMLFAFETGSSSNPDGYVGTLSNKTKAIYFLAGNGAGGAGAASIDYNLGLRVGTAANIASANVGASITPAGQAYFGGPVSIGTTTPTVALEVSGSAKISGTVQVAGTGSESCGANEHGAIRLNPSTGALQVCRQ